MQQVNESRVRQFMREHGDDGIRIGAYIHFSDGAIMEANGVGVLMDPPRHPYERAQRVCQYWKEVLRRAVKTFHERKRSLDALISANRQNARPAPNQAALVPVREALEEVKRIKRCLSHAKKELDKATPESLKNQKRRQDEIAEFTAIETELRRLQLGDLDNLEVEEDLK